MTRDVKSDKNAIPLRIVSMGVAEAEAKTDAQALYNEQGEPDPASPVETLVPAEDTPIITPDEP